MQRLIARNDMNNRCVYDLYKRARLLMARSLLRPAISSLDLTAVGHFVACQCKRRLLLGQTTLLVSCFCEFDIMAGKLRTIRQMEMVTDDENYMYTLEKCNKTKTKMYWKCRRRNCPGRLHSFSNYDPPRKVNIHNHLPDNHEVKKMEIWSQMKEAALTTEAQIAEIVDSHMGGLDPEIRGQFPARETLTRCVRRWRDKQGCHYHAGILFIQRFCLHFAF